MKQKHQNIIEVPGGETRILLHACCAPCSGAIIEAMLKLGLRPGIFFSNSNIYPLKEYEVRKEECRRYAEENNLLFVDDDYDHFQWKEIAKGLENEPERGLRCEKCFSFRLARAAKFAHDNGYKILTTTLASSRWKDLEQVNRAGEWACSKYDDVLWWNQNWRKGGMQERRGQIIKEKHFYNQEYCGCEFSLRDRIEYDKAKGVTESPVLRSLIDNCGL